MQLPAAGGAPGLGGLPPGFPGAGLPPGLTGLPTSSAASLLAGLPAGIPASSAAAFAAAAHQMGARLPAPPGLPQGVPNPHELYKKAEEEQKSSAQPGPMSDDRNVSC